MELIPRASSIIERAIESHAFPAASIEVGRRDRVLWRQGFGRFMYAPEAPAAADDTIFDLASLTKVMATGAQAMRAVEAGVLRLDERAAHYLPRWRGADRETVTIADLLEHASGLTAYLPFFRDHQGRADFEAAICALPLEYAPRSQSIYSDLGFMLLGFVLDDLGFPLSEFRPSEFRLKAEATGNADAAERETSRLELCSFRLQPDDRRRCAPTELDLWRGRLLQGEVHDENAYALGGVAGHAGLFGTAAAVGTFARGVLEGLEGDGGPPTRVAKAERPSLKVRRTTLLRFVRKSTVPGSSRALGWDTMLPTSSCGTKMSSRAIGHTGFTGTSLWIDPELDLYVVFLTNRVHPTRENNRIQPVRRALHDAIVDSVRSCTDRQTAV